MIVKMEITEFQNIESDNIFCFVSIDILRECIFLDMTDNTEEMTKHKENIKQNIKT